MPSAVALSVRSSSPPRAFGHFALRRLLGKSEATMRWLAIDTRTGARGDAVAAAHAACRRRRASATGCCRRAARRVSTIPNIAPVAECGVHEHWPFVAVDRRAGVTLDEWLAQHPPPAVDDGRVWIASVLRGLAFAHDAGIAHLDLQLHNVLVNERGQACVMALVGRARRGPRAPPMRACAAATAAPGADRARDACARNAPPPSATCSPAASLLHRLLAGEPVLDSADIAPVDRRGWRRSAARSSACRGRRRSRSPSRCARSPTAAPSSQVRLRYRNARTFLGALTGWREAAAEDDGGPVALLLDRLRTVGHLPALPGLAARVQRVTAIESQRTDEIARHLLPDMALSFELLRTLSSARVQGTQIAGNGPVLTLRRVVALIGVDGVRAAANSLRVVARPARRRGRARAARDDRSRAPGRPSGPGAAPGRLRRRGGLPGRRAAEPRPAAGALPLRRRGRADPPADPADSGEPRSMAKSPLRSSPGWAKRRRPTPSSGSTSRRSAAPRHATGASATRSCT